MFPGSAHLFFLMPLSQLCLFHIKTDGRPTRYFDVDPPILSFLSADWDCNIKVTPHQ